MTVPLPQYPAEAVERIKSALLAGFMLGEDIADDLAALLSYIEAMKWRPIEEYEIPIWVPWSLSIDGPSVILRTKERVGEGFARVTEDLSIQSPDDSAFKIEWRWANDSCSCCWESMKEPPIGWMPLPPAPDREG